MAICTLCCELAKNGYFVAAVGHAYESGQLDFPDGTVIHPDKSLFRKQIDPFFKGLFESIRVQNGKDTPEEQYEKFNGYQKKYCGFMIGRLQEWGADVLYIIELLKADFSAYVDFERGIGLSGHSYGGCLSYWLCQNHPQFRCGINIDGAIFGDYTGKTMTKPFLQINTPKNASVVSKALLDTAAPVRLQLPELLISAKNCVLAASERLRSIAACSGFMPFF